MMLKKTLTYSAALAFIVMFGGCDKEIAYNSNSGHDGSRDSATQLLINTSKVDDINATTGDNEDWFYFSAPEKGFIKVSAFVDNPHDLTVSITVMDNFGRPLHTLSTTPSTNLFELPEMAVESENYFIALKTTQGKSSYTIRADFRLPDPEPDCVIGTYACFENVLKQCQKTGYELVVACEGETPLCDAEMGECKEKVASSGSSRKCVPADKCKKGQKCCKTAETSSDEGILETEKTIKGTIVLVTPRSGDLADVKINGLGSKKGVKKGAKAYLRGLKRKVDIYDCKTTYCMATIKATSEELTHYDSVDVVVD